MGKLAAHLIPNHWGQEDEKQLARWRPKSVKVIDRFDRVPQLFALSPQSLFALRDHPLSEQHEDARKNPVATGLRHADDWFAKLAKWQWPIPPEQIVVLGLNEPPVWESVTPWVEYTSAFLERLTWHGIRGGALNLSVGWPANTGEDTPPNWAPYEPVRKSILRGDHFLFLHEYWSHAGPAHMWGWWAGRYTQCPWDVPIIIGECGIDEYVADGGVPGDKRGWQGWLSPAEYASQLQAYAQMLDRDPRIHSAQVYTWDFSHPWQSFDLRGEVLAAMPPNDDFNHTYIPQVNTPPATVPKLVYVIATAGANIRDAPVTGQVLTAVPYGEQVSIVGGDDTSGWFRVKYRTHEGWMSPSLVSTDKPPTVSLPTPVPPQGEDKWKRSIAFTAKWEGGYQNIHNDKGNWTGGEVGKGELKGTNWGISAASYPHLDIKNLTREQAHEIYRRDYWQASGADKLDWPGCLIVFDTAVLHGVGTAKLWLAEAGPDPYMFAAKRLRSYTKMGNWDFWGKAWVLRVCDLLEQAGKS